MSQFGNEALLGFFYRQKFYFPMQFQTSSKRTYLGVSMNVFINHSLYMRYSSFQYETGVSQNRLIQI